MPHASFTARWIMAVRPPASGQIDYFDTHPPGVGLRVAVSGRKTWFVMYRAHGRLRRFTLGTYPTLSLADARKQALDARHAVVQGEDPATQKQQLLKAPRVSELAREYLDKYARVHKKSWRSDERLLGREVLPHWGPRQVSGIRRRDVLVLLDGLVARGAPIQANRTLSLIRKMFNWAIERDMLDSNPCLQVKPPGKEHQRERVLTETEIRAVWDACAQLGTLMGAYFRFRLLTAQRSEETLRMRWSDVDLVTRWWTIPGSMAKNGLAHRVPLSPPALGILHLLQTTHGGSEWVFPSPRKRGAPVRQTDKPKKRLVAASDVAFVSHDLRRTASSHITSIGFARFIAGKVLNHVESGVTAVYDRHSYDQEKRQALEAWGRKVMALVSAETGTVVPFQRQG